MSVVDIGVTVLCISLSILLRMKIREDESSRSRPRGYILRNQVTHARLLPAESANAFTYPTLSLLVSVDALEDHQLDLGRGGVFGYGGLWERLVGLRSKPYLTPNPGTIRSKLEAILRDRDFTDEKHGLLDAWMMTMPSFLGFEGMNPLTVYFCYGLDGGFWLVVLEIHNTFGETHVHVLEVDKKEERPSKGYDHQWTFPREFHVSPFNDRSGFYTISVKLPTHPPMAGAEEPFTPPRPSVRVHLSTCLEDNPTSKGELKLTALLRPTNATRLTTISLLLALAQAPFVLLLTIPRTLFVAWKLHYQKRLDVFLRPAPLPAVKGWDVPPKPKLPPLINEVPGGVKWLDEGPLDRFAKHKVDRFLRRRVQETNIRVTVIAADPSVPEVIYSPPVPSSQLTISYLSPRAFTILFLSPSAAHALLLGVDVEKEFSVSSREQFLSLFSSSTILLPSSKIHRATFLQRARCRTLPSSLELDFPSSHFLDTKTLLDLLSSSYVIFLHWLLDGFERHIFTITKTRIVEGQEPWLQWERAAALLHGELQTKKAPRLGSVRRAC